MTAASWSSNWEQIETVIAGWCEGPSDVAEDATQPAEPDDAPHPACNASWASVCDACREACGRWRSAGDVPPPSIAERTHDGIVFEWWIQKRSWRMHFQPGAAVTVSTVNDGRILVTLSTHCTSLQQLEQRFFEPLVRAAMIGVANAPGAGPDAGDAPCAEAT